MNLIEALQAENEKSREHIKQLDETAALLHGEGKTADDDPGLRMSKAVSLSLIQSTEAAIASGDVIRMLEAASLHGLDGREWDAHNQQQENENVQEE